MTSLQSQYLLCPPLACNTARTRLGIHSMNRRIRPDLNPIEHLWGDFDRRVRSCQPAPQTLQDLQQALEQNLGRIPQDRIRRFIECMPRRVRAVLQANGGHNRY
jgi:hypothetical protein